MYILAHTKIKVNYLHLQEEVLRFSPLETMLRELAAHPLDLSALLHRAELSIKLPDSPAEEIIPGSQPWADTLGVLELPHDGRCRVRVANPNSYKLLEGGGTVAIKEDVSTHMLPL